MHYSTCFSGQIYPCFFQQTKAFKFLIIPVTAYAQSKVYEYRITGILYPLHKGFAAMATPFMTVYAPVLHRNISRTVKAVVQTHYIFFECYSGCYNFKCRSRLVSIADAAVSPCLVMIFARKRVIEIVLGIVGHSIDFAIHRIHDYDAHTVSKVFIICLSGLLLTDSLYVYIQCCDKCIALFWCLSSLLIALHLHTSAITYCIYFSGFSEKDIIISRFKSDNALSISP